MPDVDKILIELGIDTRPLDKDKQEAINKLRSLVNETNRLGGEQAGQKFGKDFSKVSEREVKKGFADIKDGAVLIFSFLGSFLGSTFSDKFSESTKGIFTGALAGVGVGGFFGPLGLAIGAGAGALLGGITGFVSAIRKESKTVEELATKFDLSKEAVRGLMDSAKEFGTQDKVGERLEVWKNLMDEIIKLNPAVIKSLEDIVGISPETASKLTNKQLLEQILAGIGTGAGQDIGENSLIHQVLMKKRKAFEDFQKQYPNDPLILQREISKTFRPWMKGTHMSDILVPPKEYELTEAMFNKYLASKGVDDREKIVKFIADTFKGENPLAEFIKQFNEFIVAGPLTAGGFSKDKLSSFEFLLRESKMEQSEQKIAKDMREKVIQLDTLTLDLEKKINDLMEDRKDLLAEIDERTAKGNLTVMEDLDYQVKLAQLNKEIADTIEEQERARKKNLDDIIKINKEKDAQLKKLHDIEALQEDVNANDAKRLDILDKQKDRYSFAVKELARFGLTDRQSQWRDWFLSPNMSSRAARMAVEAARWIENWEARAKQLNLMGLFEQAKQAQIKADEIRSRLEQLTSAERDPQKQMAKSLDDIGKSNRALLRRAEELGVKIVPSMGP